MVRENLVIMDVVTTKFGQRKQVQLSKSLAIFLLLLFVGCLVATGLLVYSLTSSCSHGPQVRPLKKICSTRASAVITTESVEVLTQTESTVIPTTTEEFILDASPDLDVRLPQSVIPHSYKLKLIPFLQEGNFTFHGEVQILVNVTSTTNNITLHADELSIDNVSVTDLSDNTISIRDVRGEKKKQFLVIDLDEDVIAGNQYYVHIAFKGVLNNLLQGCYRSSYKENNETRWILATQFQPTDARTCFPCFDEPGMKARFQINIARLKNMTSISNMRIVNSNPTSNLPHYVWDEYEESVPMSTYLIAFVVSDFERISKGKVSIWARRSALSQAHYALEVGPKILEYYEKYFEIKYPLPKLDMVAIPDFSAGAMENWGLVTYRESDLLYEKGVSSRSSLHRIAHVVAHELAHQWFGNLVTPTWWTDLWLNEGFATFMEYLGSYSVDPDWKDLDLIVVSGVQAAFGLDALSTSHQISIKVNNPDEVNDIFDRISYCKGASIIRMMQNFISYEIFHIAINKYLSSRMYSNAEQDDLWNVLTTVGHENNALDINITIKEIMDTWTLQVGYPVVTARVTDDAIALTQERFFLNRENKLDNSLWWIPITYADSKGRLNGDIWMRKEIEITMPYVDLDSDGWFILNVNQAGYYRVNYDIENWQKIAKQLSTKEGLKAFNPKNRAQLLDDALNLAFAGYISYDIALNVTTYLINEREYVPWRTGLNSLDYLYDMFLRTAHFDKYKSYILHIIRDFYTELGFKESADDEHLSVLSRTDIVGKACLLGLRDCVINAVQKFQNWKNTPNPDMDNDISPDLREIVYCTAISDGGQEEWDFAWQRYLNTNVANEKEILLAALGCSKHTWILSRYLEWATTENSGIRKHDFVIVFASIASNPIGKDLTYRFFKTQWDRIRSYLGPSSSFLVSLVRTATAHFNTEEEVNDFKSFLSRKRDEFGVALRTAQQSIEQAEANVKWMKTNFDTIVKWLENVKR